MKCKNCGHEIKKNNRKIIRPPGGKPYSVCRICPKDKIVSPALRNYSPGKNEATARSTKAPVPRQEAQRPAAPVLKVSSPPRAGMTTTSTLGAIAPFIQGKERGIILEGEFQGPPEMRYFIRQATADKIKRAAAGKIGGPTMTIEIIPAPAEQVDAFPDQFNDLIEISIGIKGE